LPPAGRRIDTPLSWVWARPNPHLACGVGLGIQRLRKLGLAVLLRSLAGDGIALCRPT